MVHVNGYLTAGRGLSAHALGNNLLTASNIEADRGGRLFDLWLQQTFLKGAASVRIGQVAAAEEFFVSRTAALFLNGTYGWPAVMSSDLPGGGPTYPLATPGARVAYAATAALSFSAGIFNGDPSGPGPGSALARNPSGTRFRLNDGAFVIAEAAYRPGAGEDSYKFGAWYHSKTFADPAYDTAGRSLAALSAGPPRSHHGDYGLYALADKVLWTGGDHALSGFIRAAAAPGDRNLIAPYADAGLTYKGVAGAEDMVGLAVAYAGIGANARRFDRDLASFDPNQPIRDFEGDLEFTYQTALTPWLILQPDVQIILHPGGAARPVPSALTLGLRSVVVF